MQKSLSIILFLLFSILIGPYAHAMTLEEIMAPDFRLKEAALGAFVSNQILAVKSYGNALPIYDKNLGNCMQKLENSSLPANDRISTAKEMLGEALAGLCFLSREKQTEETAVYSKSFYTACAVACAYLGASSKSISTRMNDVIIYPAAAYINQYLAKTVFRYEDSSDGYESDMEVELIPEMEMAIVHFTQADTNRETFDRWDGICKFDGKNLITCSSQKDSPIKFRFVLKFTPDKLITVKNNNFNEFLSDGSRSVVHLCKEFKKAK